ncbi:MAG: hypothetical protein RMJ04_12635 [Geminicoccaceae bacterium]|nr:hypothetical protein [Geminicoccaceae bacterium]
MRKAVLPALAATFCLAADLAAGELRLERVVLSDGGVALFDHTAELDAAEALELVLPRAQIDDLLKSLLLFDVPGTAAAVTLSGEARSGDLLRDLPLADGDLASLPALLAALRGVEVAVGGPQAIEGRILSVVPEERREGEARIARHRLTLAGVHGLRSVVLEDAESIRIRDPAMAAVLATALERFARAREPGERRLAVRLRGGDARRVRLVWLAEAPIWKMSYRVLLEPGRARLQGWAVVDNRSGRDWSEVELVLVAGGPVTLRQALSRLFWAERPEVPVRLPEGIRPRIDEGALPPPPVAAAPGRAARAATAAPAERAFEPEALAKAAEPAALLAAEAAESPTQSFFRLPGRVSIPDRGSALVPVLDRTLPAEPIVLLQADRAPDRPLLALRIHNDGPGALPPGLLTVYARAPEGGIGFSGDAELPLLPVGESRLLPFARDRATTVVVEPSAEEGIVAMTLAEGVLALERVARQITRYRVRSRAEEARVFVLEHPKRPGFRLAAPAPTAEGPGFWRFERALGAGETLSLEVVLERPEFERLELVDLDAERLAVLFAGREIPEPLRRAMAEIARLRAALREAGELRDRLEKERGELVAEQERLRANLAAVPAGSDLARRFLERLGASEDRLQALGEELARARAAVAAAEAALRAFVRDLAL